MIRCHDTRDKAVVPSNVHRRARKARAPDAVNLDHLPVLDRTVHHVDPVANLASGMALPCDPDLVQPRPVYPEPVHHRRGPVAHDAAGVDLWPCALDQHAMALLGFGMQAKPGTPSSSHVRSGPARIGSADHGSGQTKGPTPRRCRPLVPAHPAGDFCPNRNDTPWLGWTPNRAPRTVRSCPPGSS